MLGVVIRLFLSLLIVTGLILVFIGFGIFFAAILGMILIYFYVWKKISPSKKDGKIVSRGQVIDVEYTVINDGGDDDDNNRKNKS